jgi:hypothetical protein
VLARLSQQIGMRLGTSNPAQPFVLCERYELFVREASSPGRASNNRRRREKSVARPAEAQNRSTFWPVKSVSTEAERRRSSGEMSAMRSPTGDIDDVERRGRDKILHPGRSADLVLQIRQQRVRLEVVEPHAVGHRGIIGRFTDLTR